MAHCHCLDPLGLSRTAILGGWDTLSDHADAIRAIILQLVPSDGSSLGNQALIKFITEQMSDASEDSIRAVRDELIDEGVLAKGKGRGGSVYLASLSAGDEDGGDEEDDDGGDVEFGLTIEQEPDAPRPRSKASKKSKSPKSSSKESQILSYRHPDKRMNNPEVGMVHPENDPEQPKTKWAYDPHVDPALQFDTGRSRIESLIDDALASGDLDLMRDALGELKRLQAPYLNWTGKTERTSFEVDTVSLHVHERIDPASILSAIRKRLRAEKDGGGQAFQPGLFDAPFENLPLRQAIDFYRHEKNWSNRLIAGDSLLVMNSLLQKESMAGQVQMIYIDPPYGIKYGSNFQPFTNKRDVKDGADADLTQEPEMIKAFRDTWELGIHSYLTYLRDRLLLAKDLLHNSGHIFVQIGDENLHHVRELLDECFGSESFISLITFKKTAGQTSEFVAGTCDYLLWYAKDRSASKFHPIFRERALGEDGSDAYGLVIEADGKKRQMLPEESAGLKSLPKGARAYRLQLATSQREGRPSGEGSAMHFPVVLNGEEFFPTANRGWTATPQGMERLNRSGRLSKQGSSAVYVRYLDDFPAIPVTNFWADTQSGSGMDKLYVVQTSQKIIERCILMTTDPGDLVFDPTCGSGTSAYVAEKWGRRWITCDTSRIAVTLAKQRLMTASYDYFALRYPHEGLKGGFIYRTVPHVTLKSIANNPDIDDIYEQLHPAIEAALADLNLGLKQAPPFLPAQGARKGRKVTFAKSGVLHEWEVPFDWPDEWPDSAKEAFAKFHVARRAMQQRMDRTIADQAEAETLYDKPELDSKKLRITGPFSLEAVPNPTVFSLDVANPAADVTVAIARSGETSRQAMWRDELLKSGIRGRGGQMLRLAELETVPGLRYLHATGNLTETGERTVISFGPEHAALEQRQVELALTEAEKLRPAPKFVVFCAFTFDPEAAKDIDEVNWPGVTLLKAQMNTDLLTEDLRKARSSNQSFWLMGQPDVDVRKREDGMWEVEVNGFDYFDTKAGELVSGGKNKIAMWSLDIDYDQRSLFPHQAFFPMAGKKGGWNRLKKSIRGELDESLLEQFHGTLSLPFEAGDNKRVAVKIVDDRGIESLKIVALDEI